MVATTLQTIDVWFKEPTTSTDRPTLLSKLAILELCGWLEVEFDRMIRLVEAGRLGDLPWVEKYVIKRTSGFSFDGHWRPMLCQVVGEVFARRVDVAMDAAHPGELAQLTTSLSKLWKDRCSFAHADMNANVANTQLTINAPSWTIGQHVTLVQLLGRYEVVLMTEMAKITP